MKKLKYSFSLFLACCLSIGSFCMPAIAADFSESTQTVIRFEDGSYLVTTIVSEPYAMPSERGSKSATKHQDYYNSSRELVWTFRVHGTFSYDGRSAEATFADYSYDVYDSAWSFDGGTASYSGATATADGNFSYRVIPSSVSVSLTCSPKGVLS